MVLKAQELAKHHGWFQPCQFENEANAHVHETTTGPELLAAMGKEHIDVFVCAYGTGGTLKGVSTALKNFSTKTKVRRMAFRSTFVRFSPKKCVLFFSVIRRIRVYASTSNACS